MAISAAASNADDTSIVALQFTPPKNRPNIFPFSKVTDGINALDVNGLSNDTPATDFIILHWPDVYSNLFMKVYTHELQVEYMWTWGLLRFTGAGVCNKSECN